jgi:Uncharacterized protein conserved in bacteria
MEYVCLVYGEERLLDAMTAEQAAELTRVSIEYDEELARQGRLIVAQALKSVRSSKTVRVRGKNVSVTDGPFAETKEQLLGFVYIRAADEAEALAIAAKIPLAQLGSVEVRPVLTNS